MIIIRGWARSKYAIKKTAHTDIYLLSVFLGNHQVDELKTSYEKTSYKQLLLFSNAQTHSHTVSEMVRPKKAFFYVFFLILCLSVCVLIFAFNFFFSFCLWFVCHQIGMAIVASSFFFSWKNFISKRKFLHTIIQTFTYTCKPSTYA